MSTSQPVLSGHTLTDSEAELFTRVRRLEQDLASAQKDTKRALDEVAQVREVIGPFLGAMRSVFGSRGDSKNAPAPQVSTGGSVWDAWKARVGGKPAEIIAVLELGPKTATQIKNAIGGRNSTVFAHLKKLIGMGIITNSGGKYSLKES